MKEEDIIIRLKKAFIQECQQRIACDTLRQSIQEKQAEIQALELEIEKYDYMPMYLSPSGAIEQELFDVWRKEAGYDNIHKT